MQYQDRDLVNKLRNENNWLKSELSRIEFEFKEYYQQNLILKEKATDLITKNDDYNKIVWELNRYYFHLKNGYEKAKELTESLKIFDKDFENKMSRIGHYIPTSSIDTSKIDYNKIQIPNNSYFTDKIPNNNPEFSSQEQPQTLEKSNDLEFLEKNNTEKTKPEAKIYISVDEEKNQTFDEEIPITENLLQQNTNSKKFF